MLQAFFAVVSHHDLASRGRQQIAEQFTVGRLIIDEQHTRRPNSLEQAGLDDFQTVEKFLALERLDKKLLNVQAAGKRMLPRGGDNDDRDGSGGRICLERRQHLPAVELG